MGRCRVGTAARAPPSGTVSGMHHLPIWLTVKARSVLVVGGTSPAASKVRLVRKAEADVTVVAPRADGEIAAFAGRGEITLIRRDFLPGDVKGRAVVYSATGVDAVDRRVAAAARAAGVPVNVVDRPDLSSFIMPAIVDRSPVVIGISSACTAPVLARQVRARIERILSDRLGRLAGLADTFLGAVTADIWAPPSQRRLWCRLSSGATGFGRAWHTPPRCSGPSLPRQEISCTVACLSPNRCSGAPNAILGPAAPVPHPRRLSNSFV